ncbi:MAG TPA: hypothetical protein VNT03_05840 [Baekduia sp.]|nr:hypothetical protein [Baekduia sp.]
MSALAQDDALTVAGASATARPLTLTRNAAGQLVGKVTTPIRNGTDKSTLLSVQYFPDRSSESTLLSDTSAPLAVRRVRVPAHAVGVLTVRATLRPQDQPADLDGMLLVTALGPLAKDGQTRPTLGTLELRVAGSLGAPKGVAFEPDAVALQVTRKVWLHRTSGDQTVVRLRGPGVARLIAAYGRLTPPKHGATLPAATVLLSNDDGHEARVELRNLVALAPDLAEVTLKTQGTPKPGSYSGTLPLAPGTTDGPTLDVKVRSETWFPIAVAILLTGSLLGGLVPALTDTARRKRRLVAELRDMAGRYELARGGLDPENSGLWSLDDALGSKPWFPTRLQEVPGGDGLGRLSWNIRVAHAQADLDDDTTSVLKLREAIDQWVAMAPPVRALKAVEAVRPPDRVRHQWANAAVVGDTRWLLHRVASAPADATAAQTLLTRLKAQAAFHQRYARAWTLLDQAEHAPWNEAERVAHQQVWDRADLDALDAELKAKPLAERDDDDAAALASHLDSCLQACAELVRLKPVTADELVPSGAAAASAASAAGTLAAPVPAPASGAVAKTAPAEVGEPATPSRRLRRPMVTAVDAVFDFGMSAAIAVATLVGYMLPLYTGTWGSWQDWLTAFVAGFGGQAAIKWALLPVFQSQRIRTPS